MPKIINPKWQAEILARLTSIDETLKYNINAAWLIATLSERNIPFRVSNLGAGVKRITTDTDTCPCCKRKLS